MPDNSFCLALAKFPYVHVYIVPLVIGLTGSIQTSTGLVEAQHGPCSRRAATALEVRYIAMDFLRQVAQQRAVTRRDFLRSVAMTGAASQLLGFSPLHAAAMPQGQKTVVVTFGGGARDEETFAPEGQENIPHLLN